jgi:hypothetical protein
MNQSGIKIFYLIVGKLLNLLQELKPIAATPNFKPFEGNLSEISSRVKTAVCLFLFD